MSNYLLSLPSGLHDWAKEQAANNNFENVGEYVESILLKEQEKQEGLIEFDRLIQEGIDSGISERSMDEILADARQQVQIVEMPSFKVARQADRDLVDIYIYGTERFGQLQADSYNADLNACFSLLAEHSGLGREKATAKHRLRIFFHRAHVIAYQESQAGITIIRVLGGRQNWRHIL